MIDQLADGRRPSGGLADPLGVYVHFPWCLKKCPYCDFLSIAAERREIPSRAYADAVIAELERRAPEIGRAIHGQRLFRRRHALALGAGRARAGAGRDFGALSSEAELEVTVECNPSSFDRRLAERLIEVGVNRVSIGVQGLDQGRLEFLGRLHDRDGRSTPCAKRWLRRCPVFRRI